MKRHINENKIRKIINETIKEMLKEGYQPSSMEDIKNICDTLRYRMEYFSQILQIIPKNTELIINNLTNNLNQLNCNAQIISYRYDSYNFEVIINGDFSVLENHPNYNPEDMELSDFIGEMLGQYNADVNYGNDGLMSAYLRGLYLKGNELIAEFKVNEMANPSFIKEMFENFD